MRGHTRRLRRTIAAITTLMTVGGARPGLAHASPILSQDSEVVAPPQDSARVPATPRQTTPARPRTATRPPAAAATPSTGSLRGETVRSGITVTPDTVTVGDPFVLQVRVRAPRGATITFPEGPDSAASVAALDPKQERASDDTAAVDRTATYRLAAWDVGRLPFSMEDVVVRLGTSERRVSLSGESVFVRTVLPADSALRVPKPQRPPFALVEAWWKRWLPWIVAALVVALLAWWLWRRRRREAEARAEDPFVVAEREFARLDEAGLIEAGERGRHAALAVDILRDYLAARLAIALRSFTTVELLAVLRQSAAPVEHARLASLLHDADLIKFAKRGVSAEDARAMANEARLLVRDTDRSVREAAVKAEAARKASASLRDGKRAA